jgi:hypothetical protein
MTKYDMVLKNYEVAYCVLRSKDEKWGLSLNERKQYFNVKQYLIWRGVL